MSATFSQFNPKPQKLHTQTMNNPSNEGSTPPIMTETMAKLLLGQRHWREAIEIYKELSRQNPAKAEAYQKEISQIKEYFRPQANPETAKKTFRTRQQISRLKNLLKVVKRQQPENYKQGSS